MLSLPEILRRYSVRHHNKMKVLTRPLLDCFGIHYFHFHQVKNDGRFFYISNQIELNEFVNSQHEIVKNNPYAVAPAHMKEGIYDFELQKLPRINEIFNVMKEKLSMERMISLVRMKEDGYVLCSFGFSSINPFLTALAGKDSYLLQHYFTYFIDEIAPILKKSEDDAGDLRTIMGSTFDNPQYKLIDCSDKKKQFLSILHEKKSKTSLAVVFTKRELECLGCFLEGLTAKQMGSRLNLSPRTIENRTEQIKIKLGCSKKSEIISSVRRLESQGLIIL